MKTKLSIALVALCTWMFTACEHRGYPDGLPEFEHYYYAGFIPWNNDTVTVEREETELIKLPVHFHCEYIRKYDVQVRYFLKTSGIDHPAREGVDFEIVDRNGNKITAASAGVYEMTFPEARKGYDTIYVKPLAVNAADTRVIRIELCEGDNIHASESESRINHVTGDYTVATFTQAYCRPLKFN